MHTTFDASNGLTSQVLDGTPTATPGYDANGELDSVAYGNGTSVPSGGLTLDSPVTPPGASPSCASTRALPPTPPC